MIFELSASEFWFPDPELAEPDGLLAVGGDLSPERLTVAYRKGIFPWFNDDNLILWYAPHERFVLFPEEVKVTKSMRRILRSGAFTVTRDQAFDHVIARCSRAKRKEQEGTWITAGMLHAYRILHRLGRASSVEVWSEDKMAGGLYGIPCGKIFCGESMFSDMPNASKAALIWLCECAEYELIDCQVYSDHLASMGARMISREAYLRILCSN